MDYYVREAGEILGIADIIRNEAAESDEERYSSNKVLAYILRKLVDFKKLEQGGEHSFSPVNGNNNEPNVMRMGGSDGNSNGDDNDFSRSGNSANSGSTSQRNGRANSLPTHQEESELELDD